MVVPHVREPRLRIAHVQRTGEEQSRSDRHVAAAVRLQELVDVLPHARQPRQHGGQRRLHGLRAQLQRVQPSAQIATEEALHRLHVIGRQHPAEVVVQLQIGGVAGRLRHGANDAGQLGGRSGAEQHLEDVAQGGRMVQIVEDDDGGQIVGAAARLLGDVAEVLVQLLGGLVVDAGRGESARGGWEVSNGSAIFLFLLHICKV